MMMEMDKKLLAIGAYVLIFFICYVLAFKMRKRLYGPVGEYDERQEQIRGIAYRRGFYTFILATFVSSLMKEVWAMEWASPLTEVTIFMLLAIVIVNGTCIFQDAYFAPATKRKNILFVTAFIGGMNLVVGIRNLLNHMNFDECHRFSNIQLVLGIGLIAIPIMSFVHEMLEKRGGVEQ